MSLPCRRNEEFVNSKPRGVDPVVGSSKTLHHVKVKSIRPCSKIKYENSSKAGEELVPQSLTRETIDIEITPNIHQGISQHEARPASSSQSNQQSTSELGP
jgi:hypothetical protein